MKFPRVEFQPEIEPKQGSLRLGAFYFRTLLGRHSHSRSRNRLLGFSKFEFQSLNSKVFRTSFAVYSSNKVDSFCHSVVASEEWQTENSAFDCSTRIRKAVLSNISIYSNEHTPGEYPIRISQ